MQNNDNYNKIVDLIDRNKEKYNEDELLFLLRYAYDTKKNSIVYEDKISTESLMLQVNTIYKYILDGEKTIVNRNRLDMVSDLYNKIVVLKNKTKYVNRNDIDDVFYGIIRMYYELDLDFDNCKSLVKSLKVDNNEKEWYFRID